MVFIDKALPDGAPQSDRYDDMDAELRMRLKNCLQTILELEPDINALHANVRFSEDMRTLRDYLARVGGLDLTEEDVLRLERATARFLKELRFPLGRGGGKKRILQ